MGGFGGFYKGEKKKQKKGKDNNKSISLDSPAFVLPDIITKKKKNE